METAVVIPYRAGELARERALEWVTAKFNADFPDAEIVLGSCDPDRPFNRSAAILDGAAKTAADVLIISDSDCWSDGTHDAVAAVANGALWAVPHLMLCRLSAEATERVLAGENPEDQDDFAERPYKGHEAGTLLVMNRATLEDIPPPVGMVGWGQDDDAWALALRCLVAPPVRGRQPCWHLHHPPQPRRSRGIGNDANLALYRRYKIARHDPARMRALVDEAKVAV